ncbi:y4mF family transcriptional regulator [Kribbella rubisoli]|uniref:Y4mF family transcriptional regulator n=1 Tax=Kribbella rubisoli TaxID=3075929 RepID=A0A4Q7WVY5_9ACTN|nr:helix-turn-helix domain-containing protein [Kribbella rubisoli]RZU14198.1 y4mF family transcriptional regulator [Kribbella rubisoli]
MEIRSAHDLGAAVRQARARRRLTQEQLAREAGVSREWLIRLERGHARLELQLVLNTLAAAGLTLLVSDDDAATEDPTETAWEEVFSPLTAREPEHRRAVDG